LKWSILTSNFNKGAFIKECVVSVLSQTHIDWEYIIVDDCSTDDSYKYLLTLKDSRIKIIRNDERKYCSSSYKIALSHASGDICGILDADDVLHNMAIQLVDKKYRSNPNVSFIYTQHFWCNKNLTSQRSGLSALPKNGKSLAEMVLGGRHCYSHWRTFRTKIRDKAELFPDGLRFSVDKNLGFTLEEVGRGAFYPKKLYFYRYYKGNMSLVDAKNQKETTRRLAKEKIRNRKEQPASIILLE